MQSTKMEDNEKIVSMKSDLERLKQKEGVTNIELISQEILILDEEINHKRKLIEEAIKSLLVDGDSAQQ